MNNYFLRCNDEEFVERYMSNDDPLLFICSEIGIDEKMDIVSKANSLVKSGLFFVTYSKKYQHGDIGVSQLHLEVMERRS